VSEGKRGSYPDLRIQSGSVVVEFYSHFGSVFRALEVNDRPRADGIVIVKRLNLTSLRAVVSPIPSFLPCIQVQNTKVTVRIQLVDGFVLASRLFCFHGTTGWPRKRWADQRTEDSGSAEFSARQAMRVFHSVVDVASTLLAHSKERIDPGTNKTPH